MPSRRGVVGAVGAAGLVGMSALAPGGCGPAPTTPRASPSPASGPGPARAVPGRQRGIVDPQPRHVLLLAYDAAPGSRTTAAVDTAAARWVRLFAREGVNTGPSRTATVAFGPRPYAPGGAPAPPQPLRLPAFAGDRLDPEAGGGDVLVQLCAPTAEECARLGRAVDGAAGPGLRSRWRQAGTVPAAAAGEAPRNLLGFKDGTANPDAREAERSVWITRGAYEGGCYLVLRRIRLKVTEFLELPVARQEQVIGRRRESGGPLGGGPERQEVDLFAKTPEGRYVLPANSHVRLAHPRYDAGARMLRRGYAYDNGAEDRGLLFLAYLNDPRLFARVQRRLAAADALGAFTETFGSGLYFVPPAGRLPDAG
ncbi:Dyp-type peroxidase [Streptomyces sp. NPDC059917]|uniref:Dyp-type peroxidase n=1 Tax=Streptomyces sp. NPDC059917 TaxID=3347002 RepID=UPI0036566218